MAEWGSVCKCVGGIMGTRRGVLITWWVADVIFLDTVTYYGDLSQWLVKK